MKVLIVDLNNFSRYPTLAVGYLVAVLRQQQVQVDVCSPFSFGVHGFPRTVREKPWQRIYQFCNYWAATSEFTGARTLREKARRWLRPGNSRDRQAIVEAVKEKLGHAPDIVLISAYTMYRDICAEIAALCAAKDIPVMVGGSAFVEPTIANQWLRLPGISAIYAGEPERDLGALVEALVRGGEVQKFAGVHADTEAQAVPAPPLQQLDDLPFPDFSDFPWEAYPNRIVPIMTGRGCEWGRCTFCADVITASGRSFRSRSLDSVISEIECQQRHYQSNLFVFLDLKLNSNLPLWRELPSRLKTLASPIKWTASVHVDTRVDNGLGYDDLKKAADSGLVRITCGLESASAAVLHHMAKGIKLDQMANYIKNAHRAGISVRLTCIVGYPNETSQDVHATADFLNAHSDYIERVTLNRFANMPGTPIAKTLAENDSNDFHHIKVRELDTTHALIPYRNTRMNETGFLWATWRLFSAVNKINCKPLKNTAMEFEGAF